MLDNEVVSSIKFINNNSFLSVTFLNQTVCLYDFKRYPHGNDLKIGTMLNVEAIDLEPLKCQIKISSKKQGIL